MRRIVVCVAGLRQLKSKSRIRLSKAALVLKTFVQSADATIPFAEHTGHLLTVAQLATALGVKPHTIYYWRELGLEPSFRVCERGRCYFLISDVLTWLRRHNKVVNIADYRRAA